MTRGDLVTAGAPGDFGPPRPALIIQADEFEALRTATILPLTSDLRDWLLFRITIEPTRENGLQARSQVMVDKAVTVPRSKLGRVIGKLDPEEMATIGMALARFLAVDNRH